MTVAELIEALSALPQDMKVAIYDDDGRHCGDPDPCMVKGASGEEEVVL